MGRYPLLNILHKYLERRRKIVRKSTLENETRILKHIARVLDDLVDRGEMSTLNPQKMKEDDILAFRAWMRENIPEPETQAKYLGYLNGVLLYCSNPVIENMKRKGISMPKRIRKPIHALNEEDLEAVQKAAWRMEGWGGARARFITAFYPATGVRPSELRLAHLEDLNTKTWEFTVRHPKGEGTYGDRRVVIILPQARETVKEYLTERKKYVQSNGLKEATALVPNCSERKDEFYSSNAFRKLKKRVQDLAGVEFKLKDFRPTFATQTAELNPNLIPDISSQLGHSSIVTTQRYYVDIRRDSARRRIEEAWIHKNEQEASMYPKKDLIEKGKYLSGYA